eukprot:8866048-Alexandrium_andersonii.AAC.1
MIGPGSQLRRCVTCALAHSRTEASPGRATLRRGRGCGRRPVPLSSPLLVWCADLGSAGDMSVLRSVIG